MRPEHGNPSNWLEKIGQAFEVEKLLEAFATRSGLMPEGAHRVGDLRAFPEGLRLMLTRSFAHVCVAFSHGSRSWVFTGMVSPSLSRERSGPVLWVNAYTGEGTLIEAGAWALDPQGSWRRCGDHVDI
jgi:hypothetical protein